MTYSLDDGHGWKLSSPESAPGQTAYLACVTPGTPVTTPSSATLCSGSTNISAVSADATSIYWYTGSCGGTFIGSSNPGANFAVSPAVTTTFYARGYSCSGFSASCATVLISVGTLPATVSVSGGGVFCNSATLAASGGTGGTIYWQGTTSGGTSTATPSANQTVTSSGTYYFRSYNNICGWGAEDNESVIINVTPAALNTPAGPDTVCIGTTLTYTVPAVTGVTSYNWTVPASGGWSIVSGQGTTSLTITSGNISGDICVSGHNNCGDSPLSCKTVTISPSGTLPAQPGSITGDNDVPSGSIQNYSITPVTNATSYNWTVPTGLGWVINSGQGTTSINVTTGSYSGQVCVTAANYCGSSSQRCLDVACAVAEPIGISNFNIFPNPNDGEFLLEMEMDRMQDVVIKVYDVTGKVIYQDLLKQFSGLYNHIIDISHAAQGTYQLQITNEKGVINRKIVIQ
ncbi:MAG TPA: T9SS type A sorting domain-containing protein [Bacteroidales bacterium]|nr:T9SS type A sorting domain-containing protein [Bacteroidales bacterium]